MRTEDERYIGRRSRVSTTGKLLKMVLECEMEIGQRVNPSAFSVFFVWKRRLGQMVWEYFFNNIILVAKFIKMTA